MKWRHVLDFGVLRIDLSQKCYDDKYFQEIVQPVIDSFVDDFEIGSIKIKTSNIPERINCLEKMGFIASETFRRDLGYYEYNVVGGKIMPSLSMYKISAPTDAKEFENLLLDYSANTYCGRATLLGRQGQSQHGIDVVVTCDDYSKVCVQCKDITSRSITKKNIDQWIAGSETSPIKIKLFVIAVAGERDAVIQEYVYQKTEDRIINKKYPIEIVFWDDIEHFIKLREDMLRVYYPFLHQEKNGERRYDIDKYPELIKTEDELRVAFLNNFVKYRIEEMMKVDIFVGFHSQLVMMCDDFEFEIQQVLYRAIAIKNVQIYSKIQQFLMALNKYNSYLGTIGEFVNGYVIRVVNREIREKHETYEAIIDKLRDDLIKTLNEINV